MNAAIFQTEGWALVLKFAKTELERLRVLNDTNLDPTATAELRGQIKFAKKIIDLPAKAARETTGPARQDSSGL
jgi:hypothetical protein